jgi:hypothetical protein
MSYVIKCEKRGEALAQLPKVARRLLRSFWFKREKIQRNKDCSWATHEYAEQHCPPLATQSTPCSFPTLLCGSQSIDIAKLTQRILHTVSHCFCHCCFGYIYLTAAFQWGRQTVSCYLLASLQWGNTWQTFIYNEARTDVFPLCDAFWRSHAHRTCCSPREALLSGRLWVRQVAEFNTWVAAICALHERIVAQIFVDFLMRSRHVVYYLLKQAVPHFIIYNCPSCDLMICKYAVRIVPLSEINYIWISYSANWRFQDVPRIYSYR